MKNSFTYGAPQKATKLSTLYILGATSRRSYGFSAKADSPTKALTLVELLLALAILGVALTSAVALATTALEASAGLKHRQLATAAARASLIQIVHDLESSTAWTAASNSLAFTSSDSVKRLWEVDASGLRRGTPAELTDTTVPEMYLAASDITSLSATDNLVALTLRSGNRLDKIATTLTKWGETLP